MSDIRLGVIAGKLSPVTGLGNISPLWKGPLLLDTQVTLPNCWVKAVTLPELVLECFGHLAARATGLPFLEPIVTQDPNGLLGGPSNQHYFATADASPYSLRQLMKLYPPFAPHYQAALEAWTEGPTLAVLDELLANGDRNPGNLLFDGVKNWIPIDYSRCKATGPAPAPAWNGIAIDSDCIHPNHLIELLPLLNATNAPKAIEKIERADIDPGVAVHFAGLPITGSEQLAQTMVNWTIDRRKNHLRQLLGSKLSAQGNPKQVSTP